MADKEKILEILMEYTNDHTKAIRTWKFDMVADDILNSLPSDEEIARGQWDEWLGEVPPSPDPYSDASSFPEWLEEKTNG